MDAAGAMISAVVTELTSTELPGNASAVEAAGPAGGAADGERYCPWLDGFREAYSPAHGYISLLVCTFGCVANALNIAVLTRREMVSPTNSILTGLAVADLLVMLEYVPYAVHMYLPVGLHRPLAQRFSYPWACFIVFHANFTQVCHTVSIWLTVTLAVWRYIAVAHPQHNREWCRRETTLVAIAAAYVTSPLLCVPCYMSLTIQTSSSAVDERGYKTEPPGVRNETVYVVNLSELGSVLVDINFWIYSVLIKLLPCAALTALSVRLICALLEAKKRRQTLAGQGAPLRPGGRPTEQSRQADRTTLMLLMVLLLFLATELPQGLLALLTQLLGSAFFHGCYRTVGELMDFLALINSAINFILYCAMSRQFRTTFSLMFRPRFLDRWLPVPLQPRHLTDNNGNTNHMTQVTHV